MKTQEIDPAKFKPKDQAEILKNLSEGVGFKLLQAMKISRYQGVARKILNGGCTNFIEYKSDCAFLKAVNIDEQLIDQATKKHPTDEGSAETASVMGRDSV